MTLIRRALIKTIKNVMLVTFALVVLQEKGFTQELTIASYNIRYANKDDSLKGNAWSNRAPVIAQLIEFHDFDIFGTQEGLHRQLEDLKKLAPVYDYIGKGRDDGDKKGEFAAVFYKTDIFKLLDKGDFWLSTETEYPNKGWDAVLPRICSWGHFEHIESGANFYFFNTHFDHVGVEARKLSAKLILEKIKTIAGNHHTILAGDFNVDQYNESYLLLNSSGILKDAYDEASIKYALNGTFNGFNANGKRDDRIDHIFVTKDFKVERYGILTDTYRGAFKVNESADSANPGKSSSQTEARLPSDHFPVMIKVTLISK